MTDWVNGIQQADPIIFHPKRLLIMTLLIAIGPMTQGDLKKKCKITWGSITTHLNRLQEADYVNQRHVITLKGPRVLVDVTSHGIGIYKETLTYFQQFLGRMENSLVKSK